MLFLPHSCMLTYRKKGFVFFSFFVRLSYNSLVDHQLIVSCYCYSALYLETQLKFLELATVLFFNVLVMSTSITNLLTT